MAEPRSTSTKQNGRRTDSLPRRTLIVAGITIGCISLALFLWYSLHVVLLIFAGILVAILLHGLTMLMSQATHLSHRWSLTVVTVLLLGTFIGVGWFAVPTLVAQLGQLGQKLPEAVSQIKQHMASTPIGDAIVNQLPTAEALRAWRDRALGSITSIISGTIAAIVTIVVVPFIGLYIAGEPDLYVRGVLRLVPHTQRERLAEVLGAIGYTLKWWLIGQGIDMAVLGILTAIGMWLIGVPLALLIGFLAAVFNFIPNFGPLFSLIPAMLLALTVGTGKVYWVVGLYVVLQGLEGYVMMPMIQRGAVQLPGALIIAAQVLLGLLAGGMGLVLATPLAAAAVVGVKMLYVEDVLGDRIDTPAHFDARREVEKVMEVKEEVDESAEPRPAESR